MLLPKVSIITPSFNQAPFLESCIISVLKQDYPNIEYIIIDGGSTDGSLEIIKKYEKDIAFWESKPDNGQSHAINKGFKKASGNIIAWLNSDDVYFFDAVSTAVKRFQEQPDLTLFYGNCVFIDKNGNFIRYFTEVESYNQSRLLNFSDYIMQPTTFFLKESLFKVSLLDENLHYVMDWDLWCKLSQVGDVHYEKKLIAANREYDSTKTSSGGKRRLKEIYNLQLKFKTTIWPHAFWGYLAAEVRNVCSKKGSIFLIIIGDIISYFIFCLSIPSVLYGFKIKGKRNLYGFHVVSQKIKKGKAEIHLPLIGDEKKIKIYFETRNKKAIITVNGDIVGNNIVDIQIDQEYHRRKVISLFLEFKTNEGKYVSGKVLKTEFIRSKNL